MTLQIAFLFLLLAVMVWLFLTEKLPVDVTAFAGLAILIFAGYVRPEEAFTGFSSPAVITMLSVFLLSGGLQHSGVAEMMGDRLHAVGRGKESWLIVVLMTVAGGLSAFMNNVAATAVLLPAVASVSRRSGIAPSRLFMPLAFGAILGGTTTLVGTPPNILTTEVLLKGGLEPFALFDFTPVGLALLGLGIVFMLTLGRRLLPDRGPAETPGGEDLSQVYRLRERLFSIHVPEGSLLDGKSLKETRLGSALKVQVVAVIHDGKRKLAPDPDTLVRSGDVLLVEGELEELRELLELQGIEVEESPPALSVSDHAEAAVVTLPGGSDLAGRSLAEIDFRRRFGAVVAQIQRDGEVLLEDLARVPLRPGDRLLVLSPGERLDALVEAGELQVAERGEHLLETLEDGLFLLRVPAGSRLVGGSVRGARLGELLGLTVVGLVRHGETRLVLDPDEPIQKGDRLLATGEPARILALLQLGDLEPTRETPVEEIESEKVGMVEAVVAPRSGAAGHTLAELSFRERYGLQVLAVWREGEALRDVLPHVPLRVGDALLLQGPREKIDLLGPDPDFVALSDRVRPLRRTRKAPIALGAMAVMIALVVGDLYPIYVAAFAAAVLVLLGRALTMEEGYRAIEWRAIFLVAAILPVGIAMERTGAAALLAETVVNTAGGYGPYAVLGALVVLSSLLSQGLDGAPTVVLLGPVVMRTAEQVGVSPYPLLMGVGLAASAAFMTPFSHKANLLVMGAGGYRSADYLKVGTPLTVLVLALLIWMVPLVFPF